MNHQSVVWCAIAALLLCAFLLRALEEYIAGRRSGKRRHFIEWGKESDIFYIPGDAGDNDEDDDA